MTKERDDLQKIIDELIQAGPYHLGAMHEHFCNWCETIDMAEPQHAQNCIWLKIEALGSEP